MRHILLIGATDGIGRALAVEYLHRGWRVCVAGRDPDKLHRVTEELWTHAPRSRVAGVECDVTDSVRIRPAFEEALRQLGQLDLLIYCAGVMVEGQTGEERGKGGRQMLEVNLAGAVHFLELAAEHLREADRGQLAAIGSVAGDRGRKGNPAYGASKAGLHAYLEGVRHRLHGTEVTVSTIKPGWVKTRMLGDDDPPGAIKPEEAAQKIADGLDRGREVFYVPAWWRGVGLLLRWMPRFLFNRIGPA